MSQEGIIDIIGTHPEIPTMFVANVGTAIPIANTLEILGQAVAAHSVPLQTVGSGNTIEIDVQYASSAASSVANNAGVASFDSTEFSVDANGFVTLAGSVSISFDGDSGTATPAAGIINFIAAFGGSTTRFVGSGNTVRLNTVDSHNNTMVGAISLNAITGSNNAGFGAVSLQMLSGGSDNAAFAGALANLTNGSQNCAYGEACLNAVTSQSANSGFGYGCLQHVTNASASTAFGYLAVTACTNGPNTAFGYRALYQLVNGGNNLAIGNMAGSSYVGAESSNILLGNIGTAAESNAIHIGTQGSGSAQQNTCFIAGIVGNTVSNQEIVTINSSTGQLGVTTPFGVVTWNLISASQTLAVANGYICSGGGTLSLALPATSNLGDIIEVIISGSTDFTITQSAGQQITLGNISTTAGVGGSLSSTQQGDSIRMVCKTANLVWLVLSGNGNPTIV